MTWRCECRARGIFELDEMKKTIYPSGQHIGKVHKDEGERAVGKNVASLLLSLFICPHWNVFFWFIRTLTTWKQGLYFHTWGEQHFITKPPNYTWQLAFVGGTSQSGTGCNLVIFTKALPREGAESSHTWGVTLKSQTIPKRLWKKIKQMEFPFHLDKWINDWILQVMIEVICPSQSQHRNPNAIGIFVCLKTISVSLISLLASQVNA